MVKTLLPPGCYDLLPPFAGLEAEVIARLTETFESFGYALTSPPLMEYTESLLGGRGASLSPQVLRLMDGGSHKVMGIRADITLQIARIAATRLVNAPLPLRLSYAGHVLRAQGDKARGSRQLTQAGLELIGPTSPEADAEVIAVGAEALRRAGLQTFVIDLNMPGIVGSLLAEEMMEIESINAILQAVAHKDVSAIGAFKLKHNEALSELLHAVGPAEDVLARLSRVSLPDAARAQLDTLSRVVGLLKPALPQGCRITLDITEARGLEYHTGITFSFFAPGSLAELGCGGRYRIDGESLRREATGLTLYVGAVSRLLAAPAPKKRVFIASPVDRGSVIALQEQGFVTVHALPDFGKTREDARGLGCTHFLSGSGLEEL